MQDNDSNPRSNTDQSDSLPAVSIAPSSRFAFSIVWVIPLVAALIGAWLAWKAISERGPVITIVFKSAEGLEPGKTAIKYRDVEVGKIADVALSEDRTSVIVTAEMRDGTEDWLVDDTRFWIVRPRVVAGNISGLGTLLSGSYIGMDVGSASKRKYRFHGLDVPPILTSDLRGRRFVLKGEDLGSLDVGSPIYFRHIAVGKVLGFEMNPAGTGVTLQVFVETPYDRFVTDNTRFWHASGLDVTLDANGIKLDTESLMSVMLGGIAFAMPPENGKAEPATENTAFTLYVNRSAAFAPPKTERRPMVLYFNETIRGLSVGAPLDFRGLPAGEVTGIRGEWDPRKHRFRIAVEVGLSWGGTIRTQKGEVVTLSRDAVERQLNRMVEQGLRAQLRTGNLISGQLYVALDFFPAASSAHLDWTQSPPEFPTMPGTLQSLSDSAEHIVKKLDKLPLDQVVAELRQTMGSLNQTLRSVERLTSNLDRELMPEMKTTIIDARRTLTEAQKTLATDGPLQHDARDTLNEVSRAAQSLRVLTDYLERHPESLLIGKEKQP
ncbi:intermembrane transport protein PqiB [Methylocaldum sp.]|uniref:PqiB family protein n=1 Tax=Methylocaldum sp. TaxID=1969727 RepID=UPI002D603A6D|nr:MlaD family protein [Methylocaldum sp.]HYE35611.1 MlaD family protein [Methylocaldum sp.]